MSLQPNIRSVPASRSRTESRHFARARGGDVQAREELVRRYAPLARSLAARFAGRGESREDLEQVAYVGLVLAISRFDPARGLAFSTYAVPTVLGEIRRHFRDRTWAVRVPRSLQEQALAVARATETLVSGLGRPPTPQELAAHLEMGEDEVADAVLAYIAYRPDSLDAPLGFDETPLGATVGACDQGFAAAEVRASIASAGLTARQARMLTLQLEEDLTQDQIADRVGLSQMQVSRDLATARRVLREELAPAQAA